MEQHAKTTLPPAHLDYSLRHPWRVSTEDDPHDGELNVWVEAFWKDDGRPGETVLQHVAAIYDVGNEAAQMRNARLIASAPALLAALDTIANGLEYYLDDGSNISKTVLPLEAVEIARAAIALAKGESR